MPAAHQPDDVDPTGVRDLLAALPDPGPMPEGLVRRIESRLEAERAHLANASSTSSPRASVTQADHVVDLGAERGRRRPARAVALLGAAAAGLVVTTVAVTQLMGDGGGAADTAAVYPSPAHTQSQDESAGRAELAERDMAADDDAAATAAPDAAVGPMRQNESAAAADTEDAAGGGLAADGPLSTRVTVLPALPPVSEDDVAQTLRTALDDDVRSSGRDGVGSSRGDLSVAEAESCWQVIAGQRPFATYVAARTQFLPAPGQERPAVALLGHDPDGSGAAWIMPETCATDPQVAPLSGPHPLD